MSESETGECSTTSFPGLPTSEDRNGGHRGHPATEEFSDEEFVVGSGAGVTYRAPVW